MMWGRMTNTDYLLRNIKLNNAIQVFNRVEYKSFLEEKLRPVHEYLNSLKRVCKKQRFEAMEMANKDIGIQFKDWYASAIRYDTTEYIKNSINEDFKWDFYFRVDFNENLMKNQILEYIEETWTEEDLEQLKLICNTFSYSSVASRFYFMSKFRDDGRLNVIREMYYKENLDTYNYGRHKEIFADRDISLQYLESYLTYLILIKEKDIKHGVVLKKCIKTNKLYIEHLHIRKYLEWQLYLPFSSDIVNNRKDQIGKLITTDAAIKKLQGMSKIFEGIPESGEFDFPLLNSKDIVDTINYWIDVPFSKYYIEKFGSYKTALFKAKLIDEKALRNKFGICGIAQDGHYFRSLAEQKIDNWLFKNEIEHQCEPLYPFDVEYNNNK